MDSQLRKRLNWFESACHGKGGGGSAPAAPDPAATARAQGLANKEAVYESARVNQIGTQGPGGKTYYTGEIGSPDRTMVTELSPTAQQTFDKQQQIGNTLAGYGNTLAGQVAGGQPFSLSGLPQAPWEQDLASQAQGLEDATYQRGYNLLNPDFTRREDELRTRLANQGITEGSQAYNTEMQRFGDERSRALNDLGLASVAAGRAEQSRLFGLGSQGRSQSLSEYLTSRTQPMNELSALLQGSPALAAPQGASGQGYNVQPADVMGAANLAYQGAMNQYNAKQQQQSGMMNNIMGLGNLGLGAYMAFSDARLKKNVSRIGAVNGLPIYEYEYLWGGPPQVGVMAQDVIEVIPEAVTEVCGYMAVDYSKVMEAA